MDLILYIDDDQSHRLMVSELLVSQGFIVEVAEDGLEGVRKARELQPDLILVDLFLPRLDGFDVIKQLQGCSLTRDIPVIFMSVLPGDDRNCLLVEQIGVQGFVPKPFQAEEVIEIVQEILPQHPGRFSASLLH